MLLSIPLAFQSTDCFQKLGTSGWSFGRGVEGGAVLAHLQPQAGGGRPGRPECPPSGRRLPRVRAVSQLQVLSEAQLDLPEGLQLLARFWRKTLDFRSDSVHADKGIFNI